MRQMLFLGVMGAAWAAVGWAQPHEPDSMTIVLYHLDDSTSASAVDASDNDLHSAVVGSAWTAEGRFGGGLVFDGDDYVDGPRSGLLRSDDLTFEAWVYRTADVGACIIDSREPPNHGRTLLIDSSGIARAMVFVEHVGVYSADTPVPIPLNTWVHLAAVFEESARRVSIVVDGVVANQASLPTRGRAYLSATIGRCRSNAQPPGFFIGKMDEIRISSTARYVGPVSIEETTWSEAKSLWR